MAAESTTSDRTPTPSPGVKPWKGKPKPVRLVASVVTKKMGTQLSIGFAVSSPYKTTKPDSKPIRLNTTCTNVNAVIPRIILRPPLVRVLDQLKILDQHPPCGVVDDLKGTWAAGFKRGTYGDTLRLGLEEGKNVGIDLVLPGDGQTVRRARIHFQGRVLNDLRRCESGGTNRHNLIIVAVDDEGGTVKPPQVPGEVRLGEGFDAIEGALDRCLHRHEPEPIERALRDFGTLPVGAEKGPADFLEELRAVGADAGANAVESRERCTLRIVRRLEHQRRHGRDETRLRDS